jgi:NAD dependent epimerase/dehydratase
VSESVLVTGAGGFIGGHLATALVAAGDRVRAFVRYNSRGARGALEWHDPALVGEMDVVFGDLRDVESVARAMADIDVVYHLGAQVAIPYSYVNARDFVETNVVGTLNVAEAALHAGLRRVVHTSTSEVYGTARSVPMAEDHPLEAQSPYAATKVGADMLMASYHRSFQLPVTILRPFNTYGPHQSGRAIVPTVVTQALSGGALRLGDLGVRRDLTYVDDTVAGFLAAARSDASVGWTVQLGTGTDVSVRDIVDLVGELVGRDLPVELDNERLRPPDSEVRCLQSDHELAGRLIGWRPGVDLRTGLCRTISWVSSHLDLYRVGEYVV